MLERLRITDFQAHSRLDLRFSPGITTIVGPSDLGKSAVVRALRWIATNRPLGDGFVRRGQKGCRAQLLVDGATVKRHRSKADNSYHLSGYDQPFVAFGNEVPQPIVDRLNVTEVNFQGQLDAPFWFGVSPGELARKLNEIVDLQDIDESTARLASRLRSLRAERAVVEKRLEAAQGQLKRLSHAPVIDRELVVLETSESELNSKRQRCSELGGLVQTAVEKTRYCRWAAGAVKAGRETLATATGARDLRARADVLGEILVRCRRAVEGASRTVPNTDSLGVSEQSWREATEKSRRLGEWIRDYHDQTVRVEDIRRELKGARERLDSETGGRCPLCGGPIE